MGQVTMTAGYVVRIIGGRATVIPIEYDQLRASVRRNEPHVYDPVSTGKTLAGARRQAHAVKDRLNEEIREEEECRLRNRRV